MKQLLLIIILFSSLITTAQNSFNPSNQTWIIYSETIACESSSNTECYLVKYPGKNDFEIFNEKIEGFNYVSGTTYTIIVRQEIKQPPIKADESVFKYVLVKVVSAKNEQHSTTNSSSGTNSVTTTIDIDFETIKCESLSNKECLLVKEKNKKEYEIFNGCIYGFTYEAGNRYNLTVSINNNDYNLIKINKKELVNYNNSKISCTNNRNDNPVLNTNKNITEKPISYHSPLDEKKWFLRMMRENEGSIFEIEENVFSIIFNSFADRFKGTGSCNTFEGIFKTDTKTLFEVDDIVSGFKHCGTEKIEQLFLSRLKECDRFEIKEGKLQLSKQWQILLWFEIENNTKPTLTTANFTKKESELENSNLKESSSKSENTSSHLYENSKVEEMQKEIEELKKLILAQQKSEEEKSALLAKQKQEVENEIVQKQLAEKQKQDELKKIAAAEAAKAEEISKQKLAKQKEI